MMESVRAWRSSSYLQMNYLATRVDLVFQISHWQYYQQSNHRFQTSSSSKQFWWRCDLAQNSFSHLVSDYSIAIDDDEYNNSGSLDTLLSSASCSTITGFIQSSKLPRCYGLEISGLTKKKMEVKSFDGFGIISINASARRHHNLPQSEILRFRDDIDKMDSLNRTTSIKLFLQRLRKILYINCVIQFSYCDNNNSWSELGLPVGLGGESAGLLVNDNTHSAKGCWITVVAKLNRIKTSISSSCELKQLSVHNCHTMNIAYYTAYMKNSVMTA